MSDRDVEGAKARLRAGIDEGRARLRTTNAVDALALEMLVDVDTVLAEVERMTRERDYAIAQWVRVENQADARVRNGHREPWTAEEMMEEVSRAAK